MFKFLILIEIMVMFDNFKSAVPKIRLQFICENTQELWKKNFKVFI